MLRRFSRPGRCKWFSILSELVVVRFVGNGRLQFDNQSSECGTTATWRLPAAVSNTSPVLSLRSLGPWMEDIILRKVLNKWERLGSSNTTGRILSNSQHIMCGTGPKRPQPPPNEVGASRYHIPPVIQGCFRRIQAMTAPKIQLPVSAMWQIPLVSVLWDHPCSLRGYNILAYPSNRPSNVGTLGCRHCYQIGFSFHTHWPYSSGPHSEYAGTIVPSPIGYQSHFPLSRGAM